MNAETWFAVLFANILYSRVERAHARRDSASRLGFGCADIRLVINIDDAIHAWGECVSQYDLGYERPWVHA